MPVTSEQWKPVPEWEDCYEISSLGRCRNLRTGYILKPRYDGRRYLRYALQKGDFRVDRGVHQLLLLAFVGPPPEGKPFACHKNDIPDDNRLENLYWGSPGDNIADLIRNGRNKQKNQTHCVNGHPLSGDNLRIRTNGNRACKECGRTAAREFYRNNISPKRRQNDD